MSRLDISLPLRLRPAVQHYRWGKKGGASLVARLTSQIDSEMPCAELWLGAHKSGSAEVLAGAAESISLDQLIAQYPGLLLGPSIAKNFAANLPFLLKVLSVAEPLSIQCHPDNAQAAALHARDPENYPDPRHKPEMAIALTTGEVLYGFLSVAEVAKNLKLVPEFAALFNKALVEEVSQTAGGAAGRSWPSILRNLHSELLETPADKLLENSQKLYRRLSGQTAGEAERWILKLSGSFPAGDVGIFHFYLMQLLKLQPGQALYFSPGNLHAYLCGDWLECMACSDNTVRGGLTPKFVDRQSLLEICDYQDRGEPYLLPESAQGQRRYFAPKNLQEFVLDELKSGFEEPEHAVNSSVELIFCLEGAARVSARGFVFGLSSGESVLIPAALSAYSLQVVSGQAFRVSCPVDRGL